MRAFTAVDIEDSDALSELEDIRDQLDYGFNTVSAEKMHLTLQFFQEVNKQEIDEIEEALRKVDVGPFEIELKGVGVFPSKDYVRVVWAGVNSSEIYELKRQVSNHSVEDDSNYDFHPHVTLARVDNISRRHKKSFRKKLEELEDVEIGSLTVDSVKIFESVRTGRGTSYRALEELEL